NLALYTAGALLAAFSPGFGWLLGARFVVGIGLGGGVETRLALVAELMPTKDRGAAPARANGRRRRAGAFAASPRAARRRGAVGARMEAILGGPAVAWRWLLGVLALPALALFAYRRFLPESPRHLLIEGRVDEANDVLTRLDRNRLRPTRTTPNRYVDAPEGA